MSWRGSERRRSSRKSETHIRSLGHHLFLLVHALKIDCLTVCATSTCLKATFCCAVFGIVSLCGISDRRISFCMTFSDRPLKATQPFRICVCIPCGATKLNEQLFIPRVSYKLPVSNRESLHAVLWDTKVWQVEMLSMCLPKFAAKTRWIHCGYVLLVNHITQLEEFHGGLTASHFLNWNLSDVWAWTSVQFMKVLCAISL